MRLTLRIMSVVFAIILGVIAIDGYLSIRREVALFRENMEGNALLLGHVTAELIEEVWQSSEPERALDVMRQVGRAERAIRIRWVWLDAKDQEWGTPIAPLDQLAELKRGQDQTLEVPLDPGSMVMCTYIPVQTPGERQDALELSQKFDRLESYTNETFLRVLALSGTLVLLGALTVWIGGTRFIGRPLDRIVEMTRRIGRGDFTREDAVHGHHELSALTQALNDMSGRLESARDTITEETRKRIAALDQLRHTERLATVGRLASGVAHELGTPLNVIAGQAKILGADPHDENEVVAGCRIIAEQSERMTKIIRQLLDFARRRPSNKVPTDITPLLNQVVELLQPMARKAKVTIERIDGQDLPQVVVDQSQMQQVFMNLIINGVQAMEDGGRLIVRPYVESAPESAGEDPARSYVAVEVRDEGNGIPPDHLNQIFDPFFTTKEVGSGTGLGLSIVHGIVEDHGGRIVVDSRVGVGSCFTVYIPVRGQE